MNDSINNGRAKAAERCVGGCLCDAVNFELRGAPSLFQYCFCSRCQQVSGSAFAANLFVPATQFTWLKGEQQVTQYRLPNAKYFGTAFCSRCGGKLPWIMKGRETVAVPAGALRGEIPYVPQQSIHREAQACWYREPQSLPSHQQLPPKSRS